MVPSLIVLSVLLALGSLWPGALELEFSGFQAWGLLATVVIPWLGLWRHWRRWLECSRLSSTQLLLLHCGWGPLLLGGGILILELCTPVTCGWRASVFWLLVQFTPAWFTGIGLCWLVANSLQRNSHRLLALVGLWVLMFGDALNQVWFAPQKRLTHIFWGYWHGPIYDRLIVTDPGLLWTRLAHLLVALGLVVGALQLLRRRRLLVAIGLGCFIGAGGSWYQARQYPSQVYGSEDLKLQLGQVKSGPGFQLYYHKDTPVHLVNQVHMRAQFHLRELQHAMQLADDQTPLVEIYLYPDERRKKLWFGGGGTDVADVYTPSIHISAMASGYPHPTLRHELVHALGAKVAYFGLGFHPNLAFTEGLAMALAPRSHGLPVHQAAHAVLNKGRIEDVESLLGLGFWRYSGAQAYSVAGSLIEYLWQRWGGERVMRLYGGAEWQEVFPVAKEQILKDWQKAIAAQWQDQNRLRAERLLRQRSVWHSRCPHAKARHRAWKSLGYPDTLRGAASSLEDRRTWLEKLQPGDDRLYLGRAWEILLREMKGSVNSQTLTSLRESLVERFPKLDQHTEAAEAGLLIADLDFILTGSAGLDPLLELHQRLPLPSWLGRAVLARAALHESLPPKALRNWRIYLATGKGIPPSKTSGIETYLHMIADPSYRGDDIPVEQLAPPLRKRYLRMRAARAIADGDYGKARDSWKLIADGGFENRGYAEIQQRFAGFAASIE